MAPAVPLGTAGRNKSYFGCCWCTDPLSLRLTGPALPKHHRDCICFGWRHGPPMGSAGRLKSFFKLKQSFFKKIWLQGAGKRFLIFAAVRRTWRCWWSAAAVRRTRFGFCGLRPSLVFVFFSHFHTCTSAHQPTHASLVIRLGTSSDASTTTTMPNYNILPIRLLLLRSRQLLPCTIRR